MESFGEQGDDSGQQLLSTRNNQQLMQTIFQAIFTSEMVVSKHEQVVTSEDMFTRKTQANQIEEDEEDYADSLQDDPEDTTEQVSASQRSSEQAAMVDNEQVSNSTKSVPSKKGLSPNAPIFVPSRQQHITAVSLRNSSNSKALQQNIAVASLQIFEQSGKSSKANLIHQYSGKLASTSGVAAHFNLTPNNILHALVSHDIDTLRALDNPRKDQGALVPVYNCSDAFGMEMGQDFYEQGEEEELLDASFKTVAREGDLSPRHMRSGSNKNKSKAHERQHSWDRKVTQEVVIRKPPMRNAKQNVATTTTST